MDIEFGFKSCCYMIDSGFEDICMESFMVINFDGNLQDFVDIIQFWENVYVGQMVVEWGDGDEQIVCL